MKAEARQRAVDEGMNGAAALEVAGNGDLHIAQGFNVSSTAA